MLMRRQHLGARKRKKPHNGFLGCALLVLISASVILSFSMLVLSWVAIQKDHQQKLEETSEGYDTPRLEARPKEPLLRKESQIHHVDKNNKILAVETKTPGQRVETPKSNVLPAAKSGSGPSNSEIYQPATTGRRFLTYNRFGGRLNNQIFQFITALQHAKVLKRTLVVPNEVQEVEWTGMFDGFGIWDLESLNNAYDIDWTTGLSDKSIFDTPKECVLTNGKTLLKGGPKLWDEWDEKCPDVINIAGHTGLLFCEHQHQFCGDYEAQMEAYRIYAHIKLSPSLLQYIPSKREEFKNKGYDDLAIHSRRAGEGGYKVDMCVNGNTKTCEGHVQANDHYKFCDIRTMKGSCAVWLDLEYQIKSKSALKNGQKQYRFVLASDGTHDWSIDYKGQFIVADNTDWLLALERNIQDAVDPEKMLDTMAVSAIARSKLKGQKGLNKMHATIDALTATLLDLFSLVDSKYFMGAYYSTLSLNACYFRGLDRIYDSNMCWMLMHPESKHAILPPLQESVNVNNNRKQDDPLPAALMSDVEHAFVRSDDGNFIVIDRYLIHFRGKQVIAVVGDGLVPMKIEKNTNGEEIAQADFTCSYGDEHNSPATIILMKGNQSYNEHYYARGENYDSPSSTNGDRFRTMIIMCEKLSYDNGLSRHPPLILKSLDGKFSLTIGSAFVRPVKSPKTEKSNSKKYLVHCLNPVYGLKDARWIIEYLEYHWALGVDHVHVYNVDMHSPGVQSALQSFRDENFITRHDWSDKASGGYTTKTTYEHAKWAAQTDCALRSRGIYDYALFSAAVAGSSSGSNTKYPDGHLSAALEMCEEAKEQRNKIKCFYTKLNEKEEFSLKDKIPLIRYNRIEAKSHCPPNCTCMENNCTTTMRMFNSVRQKFIANVRDLTIPPSISNYEKDMNIKIEKQSFDLAEQQETINSSRVQIMNVQLKKDLAEQRETINKSRAQMNAAKNELQKHQITFHKSEAQMLAAIQEFQKQQHELTKRLDEQEIELSTTFHVLDQVVNGVL